MPFGMEAGYTPKGYEAQTFAPVPQVQGNADMLEFLRQIARRQQLGNMAREQRSAPYAQGIGQGPVQQERDTHQDAFTRQIQAIQLQKAQAELANSQARPKDFGEMRADRYGNWGTFVDPANIPAALQGTIMGGQYGDIGNWDSNNPMIAGPQQAIANKYRY